MPRLVLCSLFGVLAAPLFAALEGWLHWIAQESNPFFPALALLLLAAMTALVGGSLFERMAALPVYVLAATLVVSAVHRAGDPRTPSATAAALASIVLARCAAAVTALY